MVGLSKASGPWVIVVAVAVIGWIGVDPLQAFCDMMFKDVAARADVVVLAEYEKPRGTGPYLRILEVLKGESDRRILRLGPSGLRVYSPRHGDQFLLALTLDHTLVKAVPGMGACSPISVVAIRRGKLRARDRAAYDGFSKSLSLDEIRAEFAGGPGPGSEARPARPAATSSELRS